jgi:hypothetical protein
MTDLGVGSLPPGGPHRQNNQHQNTNGVLEASQHSLPKGSNGVLSPSNTPVIKASASQSPSHQPSGISQLTTKPKNGTAAEILQAAKTRESLPYSSRVTGICYDTRMRFHTVPDLTDDHPEDPDRITSIFNELREAGLVNIGGPPIEFPTQGLVRIPAYSALKNEICLVHTEEHYNFIKATAGTLSPSLIP